jgi:small-conductance mechanosensitive channel
VIILAVGIGIVLAFVLAAVLGALTSSMSRRFKGVPNLTRRLRRPLRAVLVTIGVWVGLHLTIDRHWYWAAAIEHVLLIALITTVAWLIGALAFVVEDATFLRFRIDVPDNRHARRIRTQIVVLRRLTVVVLTLGAVAAALLTFPAARAFGTGLIASAGLLSIVAGLAAQSSLANVFAGLQLAFTDAIRVDDVVVVDNQWGRIEELTLTYVVVHVWDDRRLILPSTHFTTTPFENWTRRAADLDVDWAVPVEAMRAELNRLLATSDLWDHRVGVLQVIDAIGGHVRVRALASALDAPTLFDLRCYVREGLVAWVQQSAPESLPRTRLETVTTVEGSSARPMPSVPARVDGVQSATPPSGADAVTGDHVTRRSTRVAWRSEAAQPGDTQRLELGAQDSRLFTGSIDAIERSRAFSGPGAEAIAERESAAQDAAGRGAGPSAPVTVVGPAAAVAVPPEVVPVPPEAVPVPDVVVVPPDDGDATQVMEPVRKRRGEDPADESRYDWRG